MIIPGALQKGDKLWIVAPAGKIKQEHVLPAAEWLRSEGFEVMLGKHLFSEHFQFAGTDKERLEDLQYAINDTAATAVLCARGGYGTVRLLDKLNLDAFSRYPKWLVGFSDVTALHSYVNSKGIATVHGVMPRYYFGSNRQPGQSLISLMKLLRGAGAEYQLPCSARYRAGSATGMLTGGNLSVVSGLMGTPFEPDTNGKILFLEDIDEYLYHTDRMLRQLKLGGKLDNLAGLVIGNFTNMKDNDSPFGSTVREIIAEVVDEFDYPVYFDFPAGHDELNLALAFGMRWELKVAETGTTFRLAESVPV